MINRRSKSIEIMDIKLLPYKGQVYDLIGDFITINITESIHQPFITGSIIINDFNMITEGYQIYSGAVIKIKFRTNEEFPIFEKIFWVYKIGSDQGLSQTHQHKNRNIVLSFISLEFAKDISERYSKYFKNMFIHEIVESVCKDLLGIPSLYKVDKTREKMSLPVPFAWSPLNIIDYCKLNSMSEENKDVGYLFFENGYGFNYVSYSELLKQKPVRPDMDLLFEPTDDFNREEKNPTASLLYIDQYTTAKNVDLINSWREKSFGGTIHTLDLDGKYFDKIEHTFNSDYLDTTWTLGEKSVTTLGQSNSKATTVPYYGGSPEKQLPINSRKSITDNNILSVGVSGDTKKKAGMIVYFNYTSKRAKEVNKFLKGHWLIESITHTITNRMKYSQNLVISKDTFYEDGEFVFKTTSKVNKG